MARGLRDGSVEDAGLVDGDRGNRAGLRLVYAAGRALAAVALAMPFFTPPPPPYF